MEPVNIETEIRTNVDDPYELERLYHKNRKAFSEYIRKEKDRGNLTELLKAWDARITFKDPEKLGKAYIPILLGLLCWIPIRLFISNQAHFSEYLFKYLPCIFFIFIGFLFLQKRRKTKEIVMLIGSSIFIAIYNYFLPYGGDSQSAVLAIVHGYVLLWLLLCLLFSDGSFKNLGKTSLYIETWGEMLCWAALLLLAGMLMSGIAMVFFSTLKIDAFKVYMENVVSLGVVMAPFLSFYLAERFSEIKISTVISQIFSPIAAVMVGVFLVSSLINIDKMYNDRDVFIIYNAVLALVIAIVFYSGNKQTSSSIFLRISTTILALVSAIFNSVVLSASVFRIARYGLTPNKFVVLGLNILFLANLVVICWHYVKRMLRREKTREEAKEIYVINRFLPIYFAWSLLVTVLVPLLFKMA